VDPTQKFPHYVIERQKGFKVFSIKEFVRYKDLLYFLVKRDVTVLYKQTVLGFLWAIINPVMQMVIFSFIFGRLVSVPSDGVAYPLFNYVGLIPWSYFSQSLAASTNSLIQNSTIFTKVYFPRIFIPITPVLSKLVDFSISFVVLIILMIFYNTYPNINVIFLPLFILLMILTASGIGMWLSALALQYRDIRFALPLLTNLLLFIAPVVYPASLVLEKSKELYLLYGLYPMVGVIEGFRAALLGSNSIPWDLVLMGTFSSVIIFISGVFYFRRMERTFADVA
jgi:lipopolysaccharide transport system permease protein